MHTLAIYSNYYYIMNAIIGVLAIVYNSILASVGNSLVTENVEKNYNDFKKLNFAKYMDCCMVYYLLSVSLSTIHGNCGWGKN